MNPIVKEKWVTALRSNEYKQSKNRLKRTFDGETTYCCLGVLCDLHSKQFNKSWFTNSVGFHDYDNHSADLSHDVQTWAGLNNCDPLIDIKNGITAIGLNDRLNKSFEEIANIIEENL